MLGLCGKLDVRGGVTFWGFVPEKKKIELLRRAHVLINTSYKEGWGLVNIEANTQGTPVVGFDVAGVRESIENGASGFAVPDGDLVGMKERLVLMYNDVALRESALEFSRRFEWGASSSKFLGVLKYV